MPYTMRDDSQVTISYLILLPIFAFLFAIIGLGGGFSSAYTLPSTSKFECPIVFLSNIASFYLGRMFITYLSTLSALLMCLAMFLQYVVIKLRLKWVNTEDEIPKFLAMNKFSLFCGIVSILGLIGIVSFPFEGMPVVQSLYPIINSSNVTNNIDVAVNMFHIVNVFMFYAGFFLFAWLIFFLNIRTRSVFSHFSRVYLFCIQCFLLLILTVALHCTVISMIIMSVFFHTQPETRTDVKNICWKYGSVGYYSHFVAIASQYVGTFTIFLFCLTLISSLSRKRVSIAIEIPHSYAIDSDMTQDTAPTLHPQDSTNECKLVRDRLSESSDVLYGNHDAGGSHSNSVLDLFKETNL